MLKKTVIVFVLFHDLRFSDEVIRGINLEIAPGMVVGVVGHSGSGKV